MKKEELDKLKELLLSLGFKFEKFEQRITEFSNKSNKGEVVITYQGRFEYVIE